MPQSPNTIDDYIEQPENIKMLLVPWIDCFSQTFTNKLE